MPIVLSLHYFLTNACYRNDNHLIKTCSYNSCLIFDIFLFAAIFFKGNVFVLVFSPLHPDVPFISS